MGFKNYSSLPEPKSINEKIFSANSGCFLPTYQHRKRFSEYNVGRQAFPPATDSNSSISNSRDPFALYKIYITMLGLANILGKATTLAFVGGGIRGVRQYGRSTAALQATKFLLKYEYIPEVLEKRGPYREEHIALANQFIEEGSCLSGGPVGEVDMQVPKGALFVFKDASSAQKYAEGDPYVANGIVTKYSIQEWNVVVEKQ